ncbi:hypothetical protein E1A91_D10G247100v1 [Gossypium mustelinum]|uniref:Dehydrogenase E1 component domain-containing protein n=1 Tax=Gossypium mustelinum TaxID=34275 RepID=A0A5D2TDM5_GOSMU|nr:hypothetical protein E1A91_D10G247100v1 [Gossypium mustelinum]
MEQKLATQHVEMQRLGTENQRTVATNGTLRQELAAAQHELQILPAQIGAVTSEREQQMTSLTDKIAKMEAELQAAEPVMVELQQSVVFFALSGDGATNQGQLFEALNISAL